MRSILYLTHDGIFDHIGQSQILPYLRIISKKYKVYLISFEKKVHKKKILSKKKNLKNENILWTPLTYHKNLFLKFYDFSMMFLLANNYIYRHNINLVHCRSFFPSILIFFSSYLSRFKFIFDIRDFWADEGIEIKKFKIIYQFAKFLEGKMIKRSTYTICLTDAAKQYLIKKYLINKNKITVIPCGTDFDLFNPYLIPKNHQKNLTTKLKLKNRKVILYYGSIGKNYLLDKMINIFKIIKQHDKKWKFFFIINNDLDILDKRLKNLGINKNDFEIITSSRKNLPIYLSLTDISLFFYRSGMRSLGCSPTKLADLFAMNIPVMTDSNLGDMKSIIKFDINCSVLINSFSRSNIINKINKIYLQRKNSKIRRNSQYYDIDNGIKKYLNVYESIFKE